MKTIFILCSIFLAWLLFWQLPVNGWHHITGNGKQTGYVSAVEKNGLFWKTGRAFIKPTLESTQEDVYCVMDNNLYTVLEQKSKTKESVTVVSVDFISKGAKNCDGESSIIVSIE